MPMTFTEAFTMGFGMFLGVGSAGLLLFVAVSAFDAGYRHVNDYLSRRRRLAERPE